MWSLGRSSSVVPSSLPVDFDQAVAEQLYRPLVARYATFYFGLPPPVPLIMGQIMQESRFDAKARSRTGALGPMQFMPQTATWAATAGSFGPAQPADPVWAVRAGIWYDRFLFDRVVYADDCHRWGAALSSYNGGLGWHNKRQLAANDPFDFWGSVRVVNPGITVGNQKENQEYPHRIVYKHQLQFVRVGDRKVCIN